MSTTHFRMEGASGSPDQRRDQKGISGLGGWNPGKRSGFVTCLLRLAQRAIRRRDQLLRRLAIPGPESDAET